MKTGSFFLPSSWDCFIQIVATARTMINEIQDVVRIAAHGTLDCVTWVLERMQQVEEGTKDNPAGRAISVAGVGLDSALSTAESLMDRVLPPTKEDRSTRSTAAWSC